MGRRPEDCDNEVAENESSSTQKNARAGYIADMTKDLRTLATSSGLDFLAYLLAIAEEEARYEVQRHRY